MRLTPLLLGSAVLVLAGCSGSTTAPPSTPPPTDRVQAVRGDLDGLIRAGGVGAVATLTDHGRTVTLSAGTADTAGAPIPTDVPQHVRVGSITKTFTAAMVLQLVAEGKIALDEPVETYLPGVLAGDGVDGRAITVRQVLQHRSGLPELTEVPEIDEYRAAQTGRTFTPEEEIAAALRLPAKFAPGTRFEYTNTNYIVAGMLVERVTGRPYAEQLRERILAPLGLPDTIMPGPGELGIREPYLHGYAAIDGVRTDVSRVEPSVPWAAGALVSTGADLNRFYAALVDGKVVAPEQLRQMLTGVPIDDAATLSYGLGVGYAQLPCGARYVGHNGGIYGYLTFSGATAEGRAVTVSVTGLPESAATSGGIDSMAMLAHALCQ
ncbi:serine hydrolase domain-containing protein [Nocardia transvalensis]|uniref:serine hydrolase domain-containing protein n=1 Tax=Nocardia transvalensis TaxID=37333 RepID=UPI001894FF3E|nr:serine hydrolase domain-containing protein [Nocardia transvalensis]MBF6328114.1 beta-lactamase family protein [Nocardia transvalensis]